MRKRLTYTAWLPVTVDLAQPPGHPHQCFFIGINGYHMGTIEKINGVWVAHLNPKAEEKLTIEDIRAIGDVLDEAFPDEL